MVYFSTSEHLPRKGKVQKPARFLDFWRSRRDSNSRSRLKNYSISSAMLSDRFSEILCQKRSDMDRRKPARRLNFSRVAFKKSLCFGAFSKWARITKICDFWAELGADGAEQRQNGNTRTAHRQFCIFEVYCK